jgi:hypothetical protein
MNHELRHTKDQRFWLKGPLNVDCYASLIFAVKNVLITILLANQLSDCHHLSHFPITLLAAATT